MPAIPIAKARLVTGATTEGIDLLKCGTWVPASSSYADFSIPDSYLAANLPRFTIAVWFKVASSGQNTLGRPFALGFAEFFHNLSLSDGIFKVDYTTTDPQVHVGAISTGVWHRLVCQWDNDWTVPKAFLDGIQSTGATTAKAGSRANIAGQKASIGNTSAHTRALDGQIDQLVVANRIWTYDEIIDDWYTATPPTSGLISRWDFEETSGNFVDSIGGIEAVPSNVTQNVTSYSTSDTIVASKTTTDDRWLLRNFDTSLYFDGAGDYVNFGNIYPAFFSGVHSVSAWIKPARFTGGMGIVTHQRRSSPFNGHGFYTSGAKLSFQYITTNTTNQFLAATTNDCLVLNKWQHVAMVYNNKTIVFYVNAVAVANTISSNNITGSYSTTANFNIGSRNNDEGTGDNDFSGNIDEVKYWNSNALTAAQIQNEYLVGESGIQPSSYWGMDEGSGGTVIDNAGSNNGTITGAVYSDDVFLAARVAL